MAKEPGFLKRRTTGEILVLAITFTVCFYVVATGIILTLLAFFTDRDISSAARNIADVINTMIGLLAGFLAGRTDYKIESKKQEEP